MWSSIPHQSINAISKLIATYYFSFFIILKYSDIFIQPITTMMRNFWRSLILFSICGFILTSCQKANTTSPSPFPITVYATGVTPRYDMRMFVGGIEITDTVKIRKYFSDVPAKLRSSSILTGFPASYTFKAPDSLQLAGTSNSSYTYDSTTGKHVIVFNRFSPVDPLKGAFDVNKFYLYPGTSILVSGGFNFTESIIGYGNYTSFKIPILNYKYRKPANNFTGTGLINNELNATSISTLALTDTIAVQEFFLNYAAKSLY
jgi:hypothetical protein